MLAGLVMVLTGCEPATTPAPEPEKASSKEESAMPDQTAKPDQPAKPEQPVTVHLALIGQNGRSVAASTEPVLGKQALAFYQDPEDTRQLIAWLKAQDVQVRDVPEAVTSLTISADKAVLEKLFDAPLNARRNERGREIWVWGRPVRIPSAIEGWVADVVLPIPPDFPPP